MNVTCVDVTCERDPCERAHSGRWSLLPAAIRCVAPGSVALQPHVSVLLAPGDTLYGTALKLQCAQGYKVAGTAHAYHVTVTCGLNATEHPVWGGVENVTCEGTSGRPRGGGGVGRGVGGRNQGQGGRGNSYGLGRVGTEVEWAGWGNQGRGWVGELGVGLGGGTRGGAGWGEPGEGLGGGNQGCGGWGEPVAGQAGNQLWVRQGGETKPGGQKGQENRPQWSDEIALTRQRRSTRWRWARSRVSGAMGAGCTSLPVCDATTSAAGV